ncbi:MAG: hypothetical protein Q9227_006082 [Pyrenula ochraceoflavens]
MPAQTSTSAISPDAGPDLLCPDWVFSNSSNVHLAKDRGWFTEYVPFESTVNSIIGSRGANVEGIGIVELPVKRKPRGSGPDAHAVLRLVDVLHVPSALCNVLGGPILDDYDVHMGRSEGSLGSIIEPNGRKLAYFDPSCNLFVIKLSGPPIGPQLGPSLFQNGGSHYINVNWEDSERQRWTAHRKKMASSRDEYTPEEKAWLKKHYNGEFHFLQSFGLKIYEDEDREEGRRILRGLMQHDE